jgi:hypothetical protein
MKFGKDGEHNPAVDKAYHASAQNTSETPVFIRFGFYFEEGMSVNTLSAMVHATIVTLIMFITGIASVTQVLTYVNLILSMYVKMFMVRSYYTWKIKFHYQGYFLKSEAHP